MRTLMRKIIKLLFQCFSQVYFEKGLILLTADCLLYHSQFNVGYLLLAGKWTGWRLLDGLTLCQTISRRASGVQHQVEETRPEEAREADQEHYCSTNQLSYEWIFPTPWLPAEFCPQSMFRRFHPSTKRIGSICITRSCWSVCISAASVTNRTDPGQFATSSTVTTSRSASRSGTRLAATTVSAELFIYQLQLLPSDPAGAEYQKENFTIWSGGPSL